MTRYSAAERAQIAAGTFFTAAELRAHPGLGRTVHVPAPARRAADPNSRPAAAEARAMTEVCAYCYEPGDERSALARDASSAAMHPECREVAEGELAAGRARRA